MKDRPIKPWSLVEPENADSGPAGSPAGSAQAESAPPQQEARRGSLLELAERWNVGWSWAIPVTILAALWSFAATLSKPASASLHFGAIFLITATAGGLLLIARSLRSAQLKNVRESPRLHSPEPTATNGPLDETLQPIWNAVDEHAGSIRKQLDEVLEEHSRISLELSLAAAQKRQAASVLDSIADPIIVTDAFDQLVLINTAGAELLGIDRHQSLRKPTDEIIADAKLIGILRQARQADCRAARRRVEHEIKSRAFAVMTSPVISDASATSGHGDHHGVVALLRDVTKERDAARAKSEFVAHAAHELRTPLTAIRAYVELLVDGEAADEKTRSGYYDTIQTSANRLGRMIDNILNISRIEAGTVRVNKEPVAISLIVKEAADTLRPQADLRKIELSVELAPVVDRIRADRDLIQQAILNLLSNAIKYTPEGGKVGIRMISRHDQNSIRIEVSDTGAGIPKDDISRVFEKFFRVEANKQMAPGTGLGLSLVKQIVETVHGGEVSLHSEVGKGSTFAIVLPLYEGRTDTEMGDSHDARKARPSM